MQVKSTIVCIMIWLDLRHQAIIIYSQNCCPFCISFNHTRIAILSVQWVNEEAIHVCSGRSWQC